MAYYVRAFCTANEPPTINAVMQSLLEGGSESNATVDDPSVLDSHTWQQFELIYKPENGPIIVECNRVEGEKSLAKAECQDFIDEVTDLEDAPTPAKDEVVDHLRRTRFIISCQLLSDCNEDGYEANGQFLDYFVEHCGAMIQADGEGFYDRMDTSEVLLSLK